MRSAIAILLIGSSFFISACGKREYKLDQQIIGVWKSIDTKTDLYVDEQITETFNLKSDTCNFSILSFGEDGSFKSYGQYKTADGDSSRIIEFEPQKGVYRLQENTLITKIDGLNIEAEMTIEFKDDHVLMIRSAPMRINQADLEKRDHYFTSTVSYRKEPQ